jgi:site-specific recombinase XerD
VFVRAQATTVVTALDVSARYGACAGRRAGLGLIGAHRLRHSAATAMLRSGGSLTEIGQTLRHARPVTTAIYAKVDIGALRQLARPWPGEPA